MVGHSFQNYDRFQNFAGFTAAYTFLYTLPMEFITESTRSSSNEWTKTYYQDYLHRTANFFTTVLNIFLKRSFLTTPNVKNECWTSYEALESTGEVKLMMKFGLCLHKFSELWDSFSLVPMQNCFRCLFRQFFVYLPLRKCNIDCKMLKIILVPDFCPLKFDIARCAIGFRLYMTYMHSTFLECSQMPVVFYHSVIHGLGFFIC